MTILSTLVNDPVPPIVLLEIAPIAAPAPGTSLVTTLQWNNLLDLLRGISADEIDRTALEVMTINRAAVSDATGHLDVSVATLAELALLTGLTENVQTSLNAKELSANKGAVSGYAALDASQLLLLANFPTGTGSQLLRRNAGNTALEFFTLTSTLDGLTDTTITTVAANEILQRNPGNTAWINAVLDLSQLPGIVNFKTDNTAAVIEIEKNSTAPSVSVIGQIDWIDDNSVGARTVYAREEAWIADPTSTTEDGLWQVSVMLNGVFTPMMGINLAIDGAIDIFQNVDLNNKNMEKIEQLIFGGISVNLTYESGTHLMTNNDFRVHKANATAILELEADHTTPSGLIGGLHFYDDNSNGDRVKYVGIESSVVSATEFSESASMAIKMESGGTYSNFMIFNSSGDGDITVLKDFNMFNFDFIDTGIVKFGDATSTPAGTEKYILYEGVGTAMRINVPTSSLYEFKINNVNHLTYDGVTAIFNAQNATMNIELEGNHTTPADGQIISQINFIDDTSVASRATYAQIHAEIEDPTNASKDGSLFFSVMEANILTDYMYFNLASNGLITMNVATTFGGNAITSVGSLNTHSIPGGTDTFAMIAASQALTNKTLGTGTIFSADFTLNDGVDIIVNATTGTKIGTAITQKLGFYNATPIVQGAVLTAVDATVIDATYDATEQAVLNNVRSRVNDIESRLNALGLIA